MRKPLFVEPHLTRQPWLWVLLLILSLQLLLIPGLQHCPWYLNSSNAGYWSLYWSPSIDLLFLSLDSNWHRNFWGALHSVFCGKQRLRWQNDQDQEASKTYWSTFFFFFFFLTDGGNYWDAGKTWLLPGIWSSQAKPVTKVTLPLKADILFEETRWFFFGRTQQWGMFWIIQKRLYLNLKQKTRSIFTLKKWIRFFFFHVPTKLYLQRQVVCQVWLMGQDE